MKDEARIWLKYAEENLASAEILQESELFNPCLQNVQQSVEKALKALFVENGLKFKKTHNISELKNTLSSAGVDVNISEDDCDFLDSIYLPSKYPLGNVLPFYEPDSAICNNAITIAENTFKFVSDILNSLINAGLQLLVEDGDALS